MNDLPWWGWAALFALAFLAGLVLGANVAVAAVKRRVTGNKGTVTTPGRFLECDRCQHSQEFAGTVWTCKCPKCGVTWNMNFSEA